MTEADRAATELEPVLDAVLANNDRCLLTFMHVVFVMSATEHDKLIAIVALAILFDLFRF